MSQLADTLAERLAAGSADGAPDWVGAIRARGVSSLRANGLPSKRDEAWKYTSLRRLENAQPRLVGAAGGEGRKPPEPLDVSGVTATILNGRLAEIGGELPSGLEVLSLDEAWAHRELRAILESLVTGGRGQGLSALNDAALGPGALVRVDAGVDAGRLLLQWVGDPANSEALVNSRVVVMLGEGARLHLVEQHENQTGERDIVNLVVQHALGREAELAHTRVQRHSDSSVLITRTEASQSAGSGFQFTGLDFGAGLARHDVKSALLEEGARCALNGACLGRAESHADHHFEVDHAAGGCESSQLFRAVADGRSRVVFNGRVHVAEGADGTDATQSSAGLLLSKLAEIDTKPELEIYADEVVASHGATVGQLDEEAMFYLRSRGVPEPEARAMLTMAFCRAVTDQLPGDALGEVLGNLLESGLAGGAAER